MTDIKKLRELVKDFPLAAEKLEGVRYINLKLRHSSAWANELLKEIRIRDETIATQAAKLTEAREIIEKLREQRERYAKRLQEITGDPNSYKRDESELEALKGEK